MFKLITSYRLITTSIVSVAKKSRRGAKAKDDVVEVKKVKPQKEIPPEMLTDRGFIIRKPKRKFRFRARYPWPAIVPPDFDVPLSNDLDHSLDTIVEIDPTRPRRKYADSAELATADPVTKKIYSVAFGNHRDEMDARIDSVVEKFQRYPGDVDSPEVQIAIKTLKTRNLIRHFQANIGDKRNKRCMYALFNSRNKMVRRLRETDYKSFLMVLRLLNIKYVPLANIDPLCVERGKVRVAVVSQATAKIRDKLQVLKDQFDSEKEAFAVEKEETLAELDREASTADEQERMLDQWKRDDEQKVLDVIFREFGFDPKTFFRRSNKTSADALR